MDRRGLRTGQATSWLATHVAALLIAGCATAGRTAVDGPIPAKPDERMRPAGLDRSGRVRLVTLNVAMLPGPLGRNNVARAERIADRLLAAPGPDVIVLLEVFDEPARRVLARRLKPTHPWMITRADAGAVMREDSGIFLASRVPFVVRGKPRVAFHPYRERGPVFTGDHWTAKGVLGAELDLGREHSLCLLATHLQADDHRIGENARVRSRQLDELEQFAHRFVRGVAPNRRRCVLLVGDLNVCGEVSDDRLGGMRRTPEYQQLLARLGHARDLYRESHPVDPGHTWNVDPYGPGATPGQPSQRLDYALAWPALASAGRPGRLHNVVTNTVPLATGLSDHNGLALEAVIAATDTTH